MLLQSFDKKQSVDFHIPEQFEKLMVSVSGGADSALLLYLVVKELKTTGRDDVVVNIMTIANSAKRNWNARKAASVIDYVQTRTNYKNIGVHYSFYRPEQEEKYFTAFIYKHADLMDLYIHGTTKNPPPGTIVKNINGGNEDLLKNGGAVESRNNPSKPYFMKSLYPGLEIGQINAWTHVDKKFIADQYKKFGLEKDLLPLTRSCEARPKPPDWHDREFEHRPCGKCWWCLEKKWAFGHF